GGVCQEQAWITAGGRCTRRTVCAVICTAPAALTNILLMRRNLIRQVVCAAAIYKAVECAWPAAGDKEAAEQYIVSYAGIVCVRGPSGCDPGLCASGRGGELCQGGGPAGALDFRDLAPRGGTRSPFADPASPPHDASGARNRE